MMPRLTTKIVLALALLSVAFPRGAQGQGGQQAVQAGIEAFQAHNFVAAEGIFSRLVQAEPSGRNYDFLAMAEAANGKLIRAIADFKKSIQLGYHSPNSYYNLGLAYLETRQPEDAAQEFRNAIQADPSLRSARYALGVALMSSGQAVEASKVFNEALRETPGDPHLWADLVEAQFRSGNGNQAVETAQSAIQAIPNNARLAVALASLCLRHHRLQAARDLLEDANELMPQDAEVRLLLARTGLAAGEPLEALAVLRGLSVSGKQAEEVLETRGEAEALTGSLAAAQKDLASAANGSLHNPRYLTNEAWLLQLQGKYSEAIRILAQARTLDPTTPLIPYRIAASYFFLKQYAQTEQYCHEALRVNPRFGTAYFLLGIAQLKEKSPRAALVDLEKAVALDPGEALFHQELAVAMLQEGDQAGAGKQLDEALQLDPKDAASYYWRAKLLALQGAKRRAITALNFSIALNPNYAGAYKELADLYTETGQPQQAAKTLAAEKKQGTTSSTDSSEGFLSSLPEASQ
jgi:tetratricopeptide (TPR) repeat protein